MKYNNLKELVSFIMEAAHDIEIDNEDLAQDLRTLAGNLVYEEQKS